MPGESCQVFGIKCSINAAWRRSFFHTIYILLLTNQLPDIKIDTLEKKNALVSAYFFFCNPFEVARHACRSAPPTVFVPFYAPFANPHLPSSHHWQVRGCGVHGAYGGISPQHNFLACSASVCLLTAHPWKLFNFSHYTIFFFNFKFVTCLLLPNLLRRNKILHVFCHWAMSNWTESWCCATWDKILALSRNTLPFSVVYSLLSALSWQVAQLLQVQRHHAVAAAAWGAFTRHTAQVSTNWPWYMVAGRLWSAA